MTKFMLKKYLAFVSFSLLLVLSNNSDAQTLKLPFKDIGACPFECCTYRQWTAVKPTAVYKEMKDGSPIAFRIRKGEKVFGVTGVVITTKAGVVKVLKNNKLGNANLKAGDTLYLLTNLGEGFQKIWYKGKFIEEQVYDDSLFKQISEPVSIWWVKIKNRRGQIGWSKQSENFGNMDSCG